MREVAVEHRAADGDDAGARGARDHHRVPPRHRELDLSRHPAPLAGDGGQARRRPRARPPGRPRLRRDQRRPRPAALLSRGAKRCPRPAHIVSVYAGVRRLAGPALRLRPRRRRDRPQPGRGDHRRARLLLHPLAAAGTAAGLDRPLLPGAGDRVAARRPRRTRQRPQPDRRRARARRLVRRRSA